MADAPNTGGLVHDDWFDREEENRGVLIEKDEHTKLAEGPFKSPPKTGQPGDVFGAKCYTCGKMWGCLTVQKPPYICPTCRENWPTSATR